MSGVRFCLERDGPSYVEGSGIWGFGSSRICTRNRGLRVGIPLGRCGFDIFWSWRRRLKGRGICGDYRLCWRLGIQFR